MSKNKYNVAVVVPTLNAGSLWLECCSAIKRQTVHIQTTLIIDSSSSDKTKEIAIKNNFQVHSINKENFDHGATRQRAIEMLIEIDIVVFLTQDAVLAHPDSIYELTQAFNDSSVGAAYGRQIPRKDAKHIEAHGRIFNYPKQSCIKTMSDLDNLGFNLIFISNSFSAYRLSALDQAGGFPSNIIFGEDTVTCAKLLKTKWKVAYKANATVIHSHGYSILEEAKRYFDTGVLHSRERWLIDEFGKTNKHGMNFVKSELLYLLQKNPFKIPEALIRTSSKFIFYQLGKYEKKLPLILKKLFSMNKQYWKSNNDK